jgi:hypothetical protein
MTSTRNRSLVAALVATSCLALPASASADSLPSTYMSDAAQDGYVSMRTAIGATYTLPSTYRSDAAQAGYAPTQTVSASAYVLPTSHKSDAAQAGYAGTPVDHPGGTRAATAAPTTVEAVAPERTIVREVAEPLPLILSSIALLLGLVGLAVVLFRTRMAPRAGH